MFLIIAPAGYDIVNTQNEALYYNEWRKKRLEEIGQKRIDKKDHEHMGFVKVAQKRDKKDHYEAMSKLPVLQHTLFDPDEMFEEKPPTIFQMPAGMTVSDPDSMCNKSRSKICYPIIPK